MVASLQSPICIKTLAASPAASSQSASPSSNSQSENPFAVARVTAADRSLLVRVLNRNLIQQREDANLQSLGSDPLLTSLPAGKTPYSQAKCLIACRPPTHLLAAAQVNAVHCSQLGCVPKFANAAIAGSPLSYPNTATARMVAEPNWSPLEAHLTGIDSPDDRSPVTPAAALLSDCNSPTSVLLHSTGTPSFCLAHIV